MNINSIDIAKLNKRSRKEFKLFFKSFYPSLCLFSERYVKNADVAQDIAQDTFLFFWENNKHFDNINSLKGFLYLTAKNKSLNYEKIKLGRNTILNSTITSEDFLYELILEEETYRIMYEAINNIAPQSRRIIELSLKEYKNPEIAQELSVSVNTVKTLKYNAYKMLRKQLGKQIGF